MYVHTHAHTCTHMHTWSVQSPRRCVVRGRVQSALLSHWSSSSHSPSPLYDREGRKGRERKEEERKREEKGGEMREGEGRQEYQTEMRGRATTRHPTKGNWMACLLTVAHRHTDQGQLGLLQRKPCEPQCVMHYNALHTRTLHLVQVHRWGHLNCCFRSSTAFSFLANSLSYTALVLAH